MTPSGEVKKPRYTRDDFISGQGVRWCPGCGDYSILASMQRTLMKFDVPREKYVFVSGIGCSSRFPYYMNTYGFHTIHGRAPTIATGLICADPSLKVWVITGDGDGLSIGGNHLLHCLRRNVNLTIVLVNNQIYGLTKGQYSPTSEVGKLTKSTPMGSIDRPVNPLCVAIASEATFVARTVDSDPKHMAGIFERASLHVGTSFIEVYQNCNIFNDKAYASVTGRDVRSERMVYLEDGKPLVFGAKRDKAIRIKRLKTTIVNVEEAKSQNLELLIHKENDPDPTLAYLLTQMSHPAMPVPFGVFRSVAKPSYDALMQQQNDLSIKKKGKGTLKDLIYGRDTWTVK
jgi:2-oxoglutarate/2-oxoacid ferredoxin oxidoreductase subunit beta